VPGALEQAVGVTVSDRTFRAEVVFPCVCGKACTAGQVVLEDGATEPAVTHADPPCELFVGAEPDAFLEACRKKLEADLQKGGQ